MKETNNSAVFSLFDANTKQIYSAKDEQTLLNIAGYIFFDTRFWYAEEKQTQKRVLFDSDDYSIWVLCEKDRMTIEEANQFLNKFNFCNLKGWQLPQKSKLEAFAKSEFNPFRLSKSNYQLFQIDEWLCEGGSIDLNSPDALTVAPKGLEDVLFMLDSMQSRLDALSEKYAIASLLAVNTYMQNKSLIEILQNWSLHSIDGNVNLESINVDNQWANKTHEEFILDAGEKGMTLESINIIERFKEIDYRSVRLPKLEESQFTMVVFLTMLSVLRF